MRRSLVRLVLAISLAFTAAAQAATPPPASGGTVYVTTLPSGADVWLDGVYIGHSPKLVDGLAAGRHSLTVVKAGWQSRDLAVSVSDGGAPILTSVALERSEAIPTRGIGHLVVHSSDPLPPTIQVDGSAVGLNKGTCDLPAGSHVIVLFMPRGRITRRVTIYADMSTEVIVREETDSEGAK
jgi:hypothetical protein